jgi:isoleucyl-tRNA synthetase
LGRSARSTADLKLRQPLAKARVHVGSAQERDDLLAVADVLAEEINVKAVEVVSEVGELVDYKVLPNNRLLGPKYGQLFPKVRAALNELEPAEVARRLQQDGAVTLGVDGQEVMLTAEEVLVQTESRGDLAVASEKGVTVAVDTTLTPALVQEGYARDLVRAINTLRKDAGLALDDRIELVYTAGGEVAAALQNFAGYVQQETLAVSLEGVEGVAAGFVSQMVAVGGEQVMLGLKKI